MAAAREAAEVSRALLRIGGVARYVLTLFPGDPAAGGREQK